MYNIGMIETNLQNLGSLNEKNYFVSAWYVIGAKEVLIFLPPSPEIQCEVVVNSIDFSE